MSVDISADSELMQNAITAVNACMEPRKAPDGRLYFVHPQNMRVEYLPAVDPALPDSIRETEQFLDVNSFAAYVNEFKGPSTRMFCDVKTREISAILDYHEADGAGGSAVRRCEHIAALKPQRSVEWLAWMGVNEKLLGQNEFAEFLEENAIDIASPDPASILEVVMGLQVRKTIDVESATNLGNGFSQFRFSEEGSTKVKNREVTVPTRIVVNIPIFTGGTRRDVNILFRYRAENGIRFMIKIVRTEEILLDAFQQITREAAAASSLNPLFTV